MNAEAPRRALVWATAGSVLSAAAASACCWLPLLLITFGGSALGVSVAFEQLRPWFLVLAGLLLAGGFYLNYFRKERCAPGTSCEAPHPKLDRFNRAMLWVATVFVAAFSLFPSYVGVLFGATNSTAHESTVGNPIVIELAVEGMTCDACAVHVDNALAPIPGVVTVTASYQGKSVVVQLDPSGRPDNRSLIEAIQRIGYEATVKSEVLPTTSSGSMRGGDS